MTKRPDMIGNKYAQGMEPNKTSFKPGFVPWNKGKKYSKEFVEEHGIGLNPNSRNGFEKHGNRNMNRTIETKNARGSWAKAWLGKSRNKETKEKISKTLMGKLVGEKNPCWKPKTMIKCLHCKKEMFFPPALLKKRLTCSRSCKLASQKKKATSIEIKIKSLLIDNKIPFIEQYKIDKRWLFDFYIKNTNILIECDGVYWHSLPKRKILDKQKDADAILAGYKVIRLQEELIMTNNQKCLDIIKEMM